MPVDVEAEEEQQQTARGHLSGVLMTHLVVTELLPWLTMDIFLWWNYRVP